MRISRRHAHPELTDPTCPHSKGGKKILLGKAGKDATEQFNQFHSRKVLDKTAKQFLIGKVGDAAEADSTEQQQGKAEQHEAPQAAEGDEEDEDTTYFGGASRPPPSRGSTD